MAITVTAPDAFYEREPWAFELTINQPDGSGPMNLTGSRLYVRFVDFRGNLAGECDSGALNGSLIITSAAQGECAFFIPGLNRTWRAYRPSQPIGLPPKPVTITGDLYRYPSGSDEPEGVATISFDVLVSTGLGTP